jgi:hypothetical protein
MSEPKTQKNDASVSEFLSKLQNPQLEADCLALRELMEELTTSPAKMWGSSIVGFGSYRYTYASGKSGDWMEVGFSPRKKNLTIYLMCGFDAFDSSHKKLLQQLGPHTTGSSCLYVKRLADLNRTVLKKLLIHSIQIIRHKYPTSAAKTSRSTKAAKKSSPKIQNPKPVKKNMRNS